MKGSPFLGRLIAYALCLWLPATLACTLGQGATPLPQAPVVPPAQTPAPGPLPTPVGQAYYVAVNEPHASDANNGRFPTYRGGSDGPWLTIRHAAATVRPGDITYVRASTYAEAGIRFARSGTPDAPIVLTNFQSEQVIIDGSQATARSSGIEIAKGCSHVTIQGLTIRHMPRSGIATDSDTRALYQGITIRDCVLHDNGLSGLRLAAVAGFLVEHVEAYGNAYDGLDIVSSDDGALSPAFPSTRIRITSPTATTSPGGMAPTGPGRAPRRAFCATRAAGTSSSTTTSPWETRTPGSG